jgi:hypothetical protein
MLQAHNCDSLNLQQTKQNRTFVHARQRRSLEGHRDSNLIVTEKSILKHQYHAICDDFSSSDGILDVFDTFARTQKQQHKHTRTHTHVIPM